MWLFSKEFFKTHVMKNDHPHPVPIVVPKENDHPHPVPIVVPKGKEEHKFSLEEEALRKILLQDHIKDLNAVVISIAGAFRKGKSFLLNFFLRYMYFKQTSNCDTNCSWLEDENTPLEGFSWRGGSERDTTGILMWSEVFCVTLPDGEKVGVIFLDTQGTFDDNSTVEECTTVFALSTMLSSIQIYNLSQNIQKDDLDNLQYFAEYGRLASGNTGQKSFQKLQFIVRDWAWPYKYSYGPEGGRAFLEKKLMTFERQESDKRKLREDIKSCFTDIQCFLLPCPGKEVRTCPTFDGKLSDIDAEFKSYLKQLVPLLLSPENLIQKEIGGQKITVGNLFQYFQCYMEIFNSNTLPQPKSIFDATVEVHYSTAIETSVHIYNDGMEKICETRHYLSYKKFKEEHKKTSSEALEKFDGIRKMGGAAVFEKYKLELRRRIATNRKWWKSRYESKIFKITPMIIKATGTVGSIAAGCAAGAGVGAKIGCAFGVIGPVGMIIGAFIGAGLGGVAGLCVAGCCLTCKPKQCGINEEQKHESMPLLERKKDLAGS